MNRSSLALRSAALATVLAMGATAHGVVFNELEPNDTKATANAVGPMAAGDSIVGNSIASTGAGVDYFDVRVAAAPLAIYRHRLVLTSQTVGHASSIRGVGQTASPPDTLAGTPWDGVVGAPNTTETAFQTASTTTTPPRFQQWYGFGKAERFYYRVNGAAATTADYTSTMESQPVTPVNIGTYVPGQITINSFNQGHTNDTDLWVYDGNLNPIRGYGNDDESVLGGTPGTGASLQSWLARDYTPGTYYIALSNFQLANDQASPSDDDFRTGALMDFPGIVANSSTTVNLNMTFTIADTGGNTLQVQNTKVGPFDVNWFVFNVVPEPGTLGLLAAGVPMLLRRRRA